MRRCVQTFDWKCMLKKKKEKKKKAIRREKESGSFGKRYE